MIKAYVGARIFDGAVLHHGHALTVHANGAFGVLPCEQLPHGCPQTALEGGIIAPALIDLQVNGGGGVMFNDDQSVDALHTIAQAHRKTGTAAFLPTLITDTPARTRAAIKAVETAIVDRVQGVIGIHLEGPHLSVARKGAHDPNLIRAMTDEDLALMLDAAARLPNVMVTVAPENTTLAQIKTMADAGIIVSLGHTDAGSDTCHAAFDAGARCATHLFNAMSQLTNREPGLVGATLERGDVYAGLIADLVHVHPASIRVALAAKPQSERVFLVSDAMATAGSEITSFLLNGRQILRQNGRLTLQDGTLAGADLELHQAVSNMIETVGDSVDLALARATKIPAEVLHESLDYGRIGSALCPPIYMATKGAAPVVLASA